ncbi:PilZ domain-containing protein [Allohahella sp. A8]|uniref:PilZ domain-containing protein n=1 Tax=Allohahella sp. A8 TaxID=3141461 RepID=UPI003A801ED0
MAKPVTEARLNVVHEAIDERQHVRTRLPASVRLTSQGQTLDCKLLDLSVGGMALDCGGTDVNATSKVAPMLIPGALVDLTLALDLQHCTLNLAITGKVIDHSKSLLRIAFVDLDRQRADTLRYLLSSWLSGDIVSIDGVFNVVHRENHIKQRKTKVELNRVWRDRLRAIVGTSLYLAAGLTILSVLFWKLFLYFFQTNALAAHVDSPAYVLSMPANGQVNFLIGTGAKEVTLGEPLAVVSTQLDTAFNTADDLQALNNLTGENLQTLLGKAFIETTISSPCDCLVYFPQAPMDRYAYKEQPLIHLLPRDQPMYVEATFGFDQLARLQHVDRVSLSLFDSEDFRHGEVISTHVDQVKGTVKVRIQPVPALSADEYLQPVDVRILAGVPLYDFFSETKNKLATAMDGALQ